jgi:hypothetical protein
MKFYSTINPDGKVQFVTTQKEVKALKQQLSVVEVPTDSDGLKNYLNELLLRVDPLAPEPVKETSPAEWPEGLGKPDDPMSAVSIIADLDKIKADRIKYKMVVNDVVEFILKLDSYHLSTVFKALIDRAEQLRKEITHGD